MNLIFEKYQGTGNDFIMVDDRKGRIGNLPTDIISWLCDRKFGVGADGIIFIRQDESLDFYMDYYNADGSQSFCGNGSRCAAAFSNKLGVGGNSVQFNAIDGLHEARILDNNWVSTHMNDVDVDQVEIGEAHYLINTGSPHYILYVPNVDQVDVVEQGSGIRYGERFKAEGVNVNFVEEQQGSLKVRTYERGVENETLSCGTGVTAVAISAALKGIGKSPKYKLKTPGGSLEVGFDQKGENVFHNIWLSGPAIHVFNGTIDI